MRLATPPIIMVRIHRVTAALAAALALPSCTWDPDFLDTPTPRPDPPISIPADTFELHSTIEMRADLLLPASGYDALAALRQLRDDPGAAMFAALDRAGVPLVAELKAALPDVVEEQIEGFIADALAEHTRLFRLDDYLRASERVLTDLEVDSTLDLTGDLPVHRLTALHFGHTPEYLGVDIPLDGVATTFAERTTTVDDDLHHYMVLGDHAFGLPLGQYAFTAIEHEIARFEGVATLRAALGAEIDCAAAAHDVASRGVLGMTVGHEDEVHEICAAALDVLADELEEQVLGLDINTLRFRRGTARLIDNGGDGVADQLAGTWDVVLDLGQGERATSGRFDGTRRGQ
jgi:hypothetical protein